MKTKEMKEKLETVSNALYEVEQIEKAVADIEIHGIFIEAKFQKNVTMFIDDETKERISEIVLPHLEEKRAELVKFMNDQMTGGIVK